MKRLFTSFKGVLMLIVLCQATSLAAQTSVYRNEIPIPPIIGSPSGGTIFLYAKDTVHNFDPAMGTGSSNPFSGVATWTFSEQGAGDTMTFLGPTLHWWAGVQADVWTTNRLAATDTMSTVHWHGLELPPRMDGNPHEPFGVGATNIVNFTVVDSASSNWYHPHLHNNTYGQVEKGLAAMIVVEQFADSIRDQLPQTYGVDDIPVVIKDQAFDLTTNPYTIWAKKNNATHKHNWNTVNGVLHPYVEVPAHMVRFRILNGSSRKGIRYTLTADSTGNSYLPFYITASDGGYLMSPVQTTVHTNGPGERQEIVLDFTNAQVGDVYYLRNMSTSLPQYIVGAPAPGPNQGPGDVTLGTAYLQIRIVADPPNYTPVDNIPSWTKNWAVLGLDTTLRPVDYHRPTKYLAQIQGGGGYVISDSSVGAAADSFNINVVDDVVCENAVEEWTIKNSGNVAHPFHIHKIIFRVTSIDSLGTAINVADRGLDGPKDNVFIYPGWELKFIALFDSFGTSTASADSAYMYHCHILTHEDSEGGGMMKQFVVQNCLTLSAANSNKPLDMTIFPNPSAGDIYLRGASKVAGNLRVYDLQGRLLHDEKLGPFDGTISLDGRNFPRGMVLVSYTSTKGNFSRKIELF